MPDLTRTVTDDEIGSLEDRFTDVESAPRCAP